MTGLVRKAILLSVCGLLLAGVAAANVPSAANSTKPTQIKIVGSAASVADPYGQFTVTVRDLANNLVPNSSVVVDFSVGCTDTRIGQTQLFAGVVPDCPTKTVRALTDGSGVATFRIMGASNNTGGSPGATVGCANIYADGVLLTTGGALRVAILDQNGAGGVGPGDLSLMLGDVFGAYKCRSDYDNTGVLGPNDVSQFLTATFLAGSNTSASPYCP